MPSFFYPFPEGDGFAVNVKTRKAHDMAGRTLDDDLVRNARDKATPNAASKGGHVSVDWKVVGRRIREIRSFDMTQEEFAPRIGISQNYLS